MLTQKTQIGLFDGPGLGRRPRAVIAGWVPRQDVSHEGAFSRMGKLG